MTLIGAIKNNLLYSTGDKCVRMLDIEMTLIDAILNCLLYSVDNK